MVVVIAVAIADRPALAPAEGPVDLGFKVVANSGFLGGMTACLVIFVSSSGTAAFVPMFVTSNFNDLVDLTDKLSYFYFLGSQR